MVGDEGQLVVGRAAGAVHQHGDLVAGEVDVGQDAVKNLVDHGVERLHLLAADAGLAVDAHAHLHLVVREGEAGLARGGHGAGRDGHAHGAHVVDDLLCHALDLGEGLARLRGGTGALVHEDRAGHAAALLALGGRAHRYVVVHHHVVAGNALLAGGLLGELEVDDVSRVVLDDEQHARGIGGHGLDAGRDAVDRGARVDGAADGRVEHAGAHVAEVGRLVAHAAARDERDLATLAARTDHHVVADLADEGGIGLHVAVDDLTLDVLGPVDELFHCGSLACAGCAVAVCTLVCGAAVRSRAQACRAAWVCSRYGPG